MPNTFDLRTARVVLPSPDGWREIGLERPEDPEEERSLRAVCAWWCAVFATAATPRFPVCGGCGRRLPPTPGAGRRCRRTLCRSCEMKKYQEGRQARDCEGLRAVWRRNKQAQRRKGR